MKKMFARMLALAMTCVVLLTGCGQNPSSSVSGSGGNGSGVQSSGDWPKQPVNVICPPLPAVAPTLFSGQSTNTSHA